MLQSVPACSFSSDLFVGKSHCHIQHLVLGEPVVIDSGETSLGIDRDSISAISLLDPVAHLRSDCQKDTG